MLFVGHQFEIDHLKARGFKEEAGAIHLGRNVWCVRLTRDPKPDQRPPEAQEESDAR